MRPGCFNPYSDRCNLTEHILVSFELNALGIFNPSGIFIYISLLSDPYRYVVTTSIRCISRFLDTAKLVKKLKVMASIIGEYVSSKSIPGL